MDLTIVPSAKPKSAPPLPVGRDSSGIALFMVLSAISVLAIVVTEFTYISQVGQMIAYGGLDQTKAHYIAKSGLKLSLLRLKAFQQVKDLVKNMGGGNGVVPKSLINKIWSFPFFYPIPTNLPGMSATDKGMIEKFQKESNLDGSFTAVIESESSKYNLNLLLLGFGTSPSPIASGGPSGGPNDSSLTNPSASFDPAAARENLRAFLQNLLDQKSQAEPDFGSLYRDFRLEDFMDSIASWADRTYTRRLSPSLDKVMMKRAPFYSVSELHMIPSMDDDLFALFAPNLTANAAGGININTMKTETLHALVPEMTPEEVKEFFKFRDSEAEDHSFAEAKDFFDYLGKSVAALKTTQAMQKLQKDLSDRKIVLVTDETQFKITVQAKVNTSTRTLEAWVTLGPPTVATIGGSGIPLTPSSPGAGGVTSPPPDSGLKITFMKIL